ncbi:MAG: DUF4440 domain-containing protein [Bacteroidota bacterium]|nr:DUF4440 domain-containing protein [Bacteroidota bacterium]
MRKAFLLLVFHLSAVLFLHAQQTTPNDKQKKEISSLIDLYSQAREKQDTVLLKRILTQDVDQLVSTGEWRNGIDASVQGMLRSSTNTPGTRTLSIEKIRMLHPTSAIVDCRYELQNRDGTLRKMWSTFIVIAHKGSWKITAIRNMLPETR